MTTTDTPRPLHYFEPGFDHEAARSIAVGALLEIDESLGNLPITSLGIEYDYNIRVQAEYSAAMALADRWEAGSPESASPNGDSTQYVWSFVILGDPLTDQAVRVRIYALVKP